MSEKFSTSVDNTASPAEAWGAPTSQEGSFEDYIASRPEAISEEDQARLAEREAAMADRQPVAAKFENGSLVGETTYDDLSLKELAQFAGDAQNNFGDKSTSLEAQEHIQNRLLAAVEEGKITEEAAMQHIEQLDKIINPTVEVADDEVLVVGAPAETQPPQAETEASKELYKDHSTIDLVEKAMKARTEDGDKSTANEILDTLKKRYAEKVANEELSQEAADIEYGKFESMINSAPLRDKDAAEKPKEEAEEVNEPEEKEAAPKEESAEDSSDDKEEVVKVTDEDRTRHKNRTQELDRSVEKVKKRRMRKLGGFAARTIRRPKASFAKAKQASKSALDRAYAWSNRNFAGAEAPKATNEKEAEEEKQAA